MDYISSKIRNQTEVTVNSHEVKSRMLGVCEKFQVSNYPQYSSKLQQWQEAFVGHPVWNDHEQVEIQYGILEFLLEIARCPVDAITQKVIQNKGKLIEFPEVPVDGLENTGKLSPEDWKQLLGANESSLVSQDSDDELSDWSDTESPISEANNCVMQEDAIQNANIVRPIVLPGAKPPEKDRHFQVFDAADSEQWLRENIQADWWLKQNYKTISHSDFKESNFAVKWNEFLDTVSLGMAHEKTLSTTTEYILLREIIWMFLVPTKVCKFFKFDDGRVQLIAGVSVTSCSMHVIQSFLDKVTVSMTNLRELKGFIERVKASQRPLPLTVDIYCSCLENLIFPFERHLTEIESQLMARNDSSTCLKFLEELNPFLSYLESIYGIHKDVTCDWTETPNFIIAGYLLAGLFEKLESPINSQENTLVIAILVPCLESYLKITDSWWSLGRLHDYRDEFLCLDGGVSRNFEQYQLGADIVKCPLLQYLLNYCQESSTILNHLNELDRVSLLSELMCDGTFDQFRDKFLHPFRDQLKVSEETQTEAGPSNDCYCELMERLLLDEQMSREEDVRVSQSKRHLDSSREIYDMFQTHTNNFLLPFRQLLIGSLASVLQPKVQRAHQLIAKIYMDEFDIVKQFQNVQAVILLESPAMFDFYTDLFVAIEEDFSSLSSYSLTTKLETCLTGLRMDALFTAEFDRLYFRTGLDTILDTLDRLKIEYNFNAGCVDFGSTPIYGRAFTFLLKIKWAVWVLESLQFSSNFSRLKCFHQPNMLDFTIRQMGILKFWLLTTVKSIHGYLMNQVLQVEGEEFQRTLKACISVNQIKECHRIFVESIERKCFLDVESALRLVINELLHFVLIFRDFWASLNETCDQDYGLELEESKEMLEKINVRHLEHTYGNIHSCLVLQLTKAVETRNEIHCKCVYCLLIFIIVFEQFWNKLLLCSSERSTGSSTAQTTRLPIMGIAPQNGTHFSARSGHR